MLEGRQHQHADPLDPGQRDQAYVSEFRVLNPDALVSDDWIIKWGRSLCGSEIPAITIAMMVGQGADESTATQSVDQALATYCPKKLKAS